MPTEIELAHGDGANKSVLESVALGESSRLIELEKIIGAGKQTFFNVGDALAQIMVDRLYLQKGFGSFAEYCETVWGFKKSYAYQLVQAAEVMKELPAPVSTIVETFNPDQVRELVKVPKEQRETVITTAVTRAKSAKRKLTARDISEAANPKPERAVEMPEDSQVHGQRALGKRGFEKWYFNSTKQKRANFLHFIFSVGKVEVEDKAKFKQRMDSWFEHSVIQSGGSHD